MRENDPGAAADRRVRDDRPQRQDRTRLIALMPGYVQAAELLVDMRDPQSLPSRVGLCKAIREEVPRCRRAAKSLREFDRPIAHAGALGGGYLAAHFN